MLTKTTEPAAMTKNLYRFSSVLQMSVLIVVMALGLAVRTASATPTCMQDAWKEHGNTQSLTCTANDVKIAYADNIRGTDGKALSKCTKGTTFSFIADFHIVLNAQTRYDIGLYFATDGDPNHNGALTGTCSANTINTPSPLSGTTPTVYLGSNNFIQLDPTPDVCGDIDNAHSPQTVTVEVDNVTCQDTDSDGQLNLPNCTSWRTSGQNGICTGVSDAYPGSPSKCNCDIAFNIPVTVEIPGITVTKVPNPTYISEGTATDVTYTVTVTNTGSVVGIIINTLNDSLYGNITTTGHDGISATTCTGLPITIPPNGQTGNPYICTFTVNTTAAAGTTSINDEVCATGKDQNGLTVSGCGNAVVTVGDVKPAAAIIKTIKEIVCAAVRYQVQIVNLDKAESITLTALSDSPFGSITAPHVSNPPAHGDVLATTCSVSQTLLAGDGIAGGTDTYSCTFDAYVCNFPNTDTVTGTLNDIENNTISPTGSATVSVNNSLSGSGSSNVTVT